MQNAQVCYAPHTDAIATACQELPSDYLVELRALLHAAMYLQQHRDILSPPYQWGSRNGSLSPPYQGGVGGGGMECR